MIYFILVLFIIIIVEAVFLFSLSMVISSQSKDIGILKARLVSANEKLIKANKITEIRDQGAEDENKIITTNNNDYKPVLFDRFKQ